MKIFVLVITYLSVAWIIFLAIVSNMYYRKFLAAIEEEDPKENKIDEERAGWWRGTSYRMRAPMPVFRVSAVATTNKIIRQHNRLVKAYWISIGAACLLFICLSLLN